jgi:hypothetical protein
VFDSGVFDATGAGVVMRALSFSSLVASTRYPFCFRNADRD